MENRASSEAWRELAANFRSIDRRLLSGPDDRGFDQSTDLWYAVYLPNGDDDGAWLLRHPRRSLQVGDGDPLATCELHFRVYAQRALESLQHQVESARAESGWGDLLARSDVQLPELRRFVSLQMGLIRSCGHLCKGGYDGPHGPRDPAAPHPAQLR